MNTFENAKQRRRWARMRSRLLAARERREGLRDVGPYWIHLDRKSARNGAMFRDVARWIRMGRLVVFWTKSSFEFSGAREIAVFLPGDPEIVDMAKRFKRCR